MMKNFCYQLLLVGQYMRIEELDIEKRTLYQQIVNMNPMRKYEYICFEITQRKPN